MKDHTKNPEELLNKSIEYFISSQVLIAATTFYISYSTKEQADTENLVYYALYLCMAALLIYKIKFKANWARLLFLFFTPFWIIIDTIGIIENTHKFFEGDMKSIFAITTTVFAIYYQIKGALIISKNPVKPLFSNEKK